ncbi:MAG: tripartite tricarboxylate transporter substrate binding protein [Alphaproteobacteria bacterium]|nr:tripartite tricarboxylate transporter substrate binding protein [Alphaproteobacteria bacterium]
MPTRRALLASPLAAPALAQAQAAWPLDRPMEVIVPFPAGGGVDVMARMFMPLVAAQIAGLRPVIINRVGAAGQIGMESTYNAAPDGHTIGATTIPALNAIPLERPARFTALNFTFLANIVEDANAFYVRADSPIRSVADLIAAARARPGQHSYATTGVGSDDHIFMLTFERIAEIPRMVHIPFAGAAPLIPQLVGGHVDVAAINVGDALGLVREGRLRILAQAAERRQREAPDVPTFRELGMEIVIGASRGMIAPPNLPAHITERLLRAFEVAMRDEGFLREAERQNMPLRPIIGTAYRDYAAMVDSRVRELWQVRPWRE